MRLPTKRDRCPARGTIGCDPVGCPSDSRQRDWWRRSTRRKAVISGRPATRSSASQQWAASSSALEGLVPIPRSYGEAADVDRDGWVRSALGPREPRRLVREPPIPGGSLSENTGHARWGSALRPETSVISASPTSLALLGSGARLG